MNELQAHIKTLNGETGGLVDDIAHWASYGITTPTQLDRYLLECEYSDWYKEVNGVRPHYVTSLTDAELNAAMDSLAVSAKHNEEEEEFYASLDAEDNRLDRMENPEPLPYEDMDELFAF